MVADSDLRDRWKLISARSLISSNSFCRPGREAPWPRKFWKGRPSTRQETPKSNRRNQNYSLCADVQRCFEDRVENSRYTQGKHTEKTATTVSTYAIASTTAAISTLLWTCLDHRSSTSSRPKLSFDLRTVRFKSLQSNYH